MSKIKTAVVTAILKGFGFFVKLTVQVQTYPTKPKALPKPIRRQSQ